MNDDDKTVAFGDDLAPLAAPDAEEATLLQPKPEEEATLLGTAEGEEATMLATPPGGEESTLLASAAEVDATVLAPADTASPASPAADADATLAMPDGDSTLAMAADAPLQTLGKYQIEKVLGEGAMGIVYKGRDPVIERTVALKTVRKSLMDQAAGEEVLARFKREAQAAGRLTHPNIVAVYEYAEDGDTAFIAMEFVLGDELGDLLQRGERFKQEDIIDVMGQLLDALDFAHKNGVVHRDIKPANVILTQEGRVKVADFGIARLDSSHLTQSGAILGTPSYMSPEQCLGQPVDGRSDLFSAGVILYQMLTGEKPFAGGAPTTVMHRVLNHVPEAPSQLNALLPPGFDAVVAKAMAKRPAERYQTAAEFRDALRALGSAGAEATVVGAPAATEAKSGGKGGLWAAVAGAVLLIGGGIGYFMLSARTPQEAPLPPPPAPEANLATPPAPPPAPKVEYGYVEVITEPAGAMVLLEGDRFMGVTPVRLELEPGEYPLTLRKAGYYDLEAGVEVEPGAEIPFHTSLTKQ